MFHAAVNVSTVDGTASTISAAIRITFTQLFSALETTLTEVIGVGSDVRKMMLECSSSQ